MTQLCTLDDNKQVWSMDRAYYCGKLLTWCHAWCSCLVMLAQCGWAQWSASVILVKNPLSDHWRSQEFWSGGSNTIHMHWRHQIFSKQELFVGQRYCTLGDHIKPWPVFDTLPGFCYRERAQPPKKFKCLNWETYWANHCISNISQMGVWGRAPSRRRQWGSEREAPSRWAIFCNFFGKLAILMPLDHYSQMFRAIWKN